MCLSNQPDQAFARISTEPAPAGRRIPFGTGRVQDAIDAINDLIAADPNDSALWHVLEQLERIRDAIHPALVR